MQWNRLSKVVLVTTVALTAAVAPAAPSSAAPAFADVEVIRSKSFYLITSQCALAVGVSTDPRFVNYVVHASAEAGGPSVPLATSVQCTVYDAADLSRLYGGASGSMPGPYAEAIGQATVPVGRVPAVCVKGGATYLDGTTVSSPKVCP